MPDKDREKALTLLFEIAFQHGTLPRMLHVLIVALKLCLIKGDSDLTKLPLGNVVKRLQKLSKEVSPVAGWEEGVSTDIFYALMIYRLL